MVRSRKVQDAGGDRPGSCSGKLGACKEILLMSEGRLEGGGYSCIAHWICYRAKI